MTTLLKSTHPVLIFQTAADVLVLGRDLTPQVDSVLNVNLEFLYLLGQLKIFLRKPNHQLNPQTVNFLDSYGRQTGLDGGHVDNGAVQLLDLEAEIVDGDFKALDGLGSHQLEIHHARHLRDSNWLF
jgi:hypothetical protein